MSFTNRAKTPRYSKYKFLTESHDFINNFNKINSSSFKDEIKKKKLNHKFKNYYSINQSINQNSTFFKSLAPFNYYRQSKEKDNLLVCYNGGPQKEYTPLITRENLSQFLKNRSNSIKYKRPCGCYSKFNISKYNKIYYSPNDIEKEDYNKGEFPLIMNNDNIRFSNGFISPKLRKNNILKAKHELNINNHDNDNFRINTISNNFNLEQKNENQKNAENKDICQLEIEEKKERKEKVINEINIEKKFNYFNLKPKKRFHKIQIFNNCKPFLVDDFKDYGYYE